MIIAKAISAVAVGALALGGWSTTGVPAAKPSTPPVVTITSRDYAFDPIPDIPSGVVDLRLHNLGPDFHHAAMFKLMGRHTPEEFVAALKKPGPPPRWAMPVSSPNAPMVGQVSNVLTDLTPGNYIVMCFIDTNGGVPHFMKGMYRGFRVVPSANRSRAPKSDIDITLFDYNFKFSIPVTAGSHLFRLTNSAAQPHEIEIFRLEDGKNAKELHDWFLGKMTTKPPAMPVGGVVNVMPGAHPEFRATFTAGHYVAVCFLPDAKDGKPHMLHGMENAFEVK